MANPSGKNSPSSFDQFDATPGYGSKKREGDLARSVPIAGNGQEALGSAKRATEIATKSAAKQIAAREGAPAPEPTIPEPYTNTVGDPYAATWSQVAATPGASDLVKEYASGA